jgi:hypothetical protein
LDADLFVSRLIGPEDLDEMEQAFRSVGLRPVTYQAPPRRSAEDLSWLVIAALPLSSFLTSLSATLAEDSYKELRRLARRVFGRGSKPLTLVLEDRDTGTQVILEPDLPEDGYRALLGADLTSYAGAKVRYDRGHGRWVGSDDWEPVGSHRPKVSQVLTDTVNSSSSASDKEEGIFISYRRQDDAGFAGRIADRLMTSFGIQRVFIDVDSIELGLDFSSVIADYLGKCRAMVVVIGRRWLDVADADGRRRLANPDDYVRLEVERALARNIRVVPVLVDGAVMPRRDDLPTSMEPLARRNGIEMSHAGFSADVERLIGALKRVVDA